MNRLRLIHRIIDWWKMSNRWRHIILGVIIGACSLDIIVALYAGLIAASALELKDIQYHNRWDWIDWIITIVGSAIGGLITLLY